MSNPSNASPKKKKQSRKDTIIALIVVAALIVFALILWQQISAAQEERTRMMSTPLVRTQVMSEDGSRHHFEAQITLQVSGNARANQQQVNDRVQAALSSLTHEEIISADGMNIIRERVQNALESGTFREGDIQSIYVTNVLNDFVTPQQAAPDRRNEFLRRMQQ